MKKLIRRNRKQILKFGEGFGLGTITGIKGSGKTHLLFNLGLKLREHEKKFCWYYADLAGITASFSSLLYNVLLEWKDDIEEAVRNWTLTRLVEEAEDGNKKAERILFGGRFKTLFGKIRGKTLNTIIQEYKAGKRELNLSAIRRVKNFPEIVLKILSGGVRNLKKLFEKGRSLEILETLTEILSSQGKLGVIALDEFVRIVRKEQEPFLTKLEALINSKPPLVVIISSIPKGVRNLEKIDPPLADRIDKAQVKYHLSPPERYEEIWDIVHSYLTRAGALLSTEDEKLWKNTIKNILELGGQWTLRKILPIMREILEVYDGDELTPTEIEEAVANVRGGVTLPKSEVGMSIEDSLRISNKVESSKDLSSLLEDVVRELCNYAGKSGHFTYVHPRGRQITIEGEDQNRIADVYLENELEKICVDIKISDKEFLHDRMVQNIVDMAVQGKVDGEEIKKAVIITNTGCSDKIRGIPDLSVAELNSREIKDLIFLVEELNKAGNVDPFKDKIEAFLKKLQLL